MLNWSLIFVLICVVTAVLSWLLTRSCIKLAPRWGFVAKPHAENHHSHSQATPLLGGLAMCVAWNVVVLGGLLALPIVHRFLSDDVSAYLPGVSSIILKLALISGGGIAFTILGTLDDKHAMNAKTKFILQVAVAATVCWQLHTSFLYFIPGMNWFISVFWILSVVNAFNFFDNMDGLAGGTAAISSFFFLIIAIMRGQFFVALLSAVTFGSALGFLLLNKAPAKIFMGDGGSHFLGFNLALAGIMTTFYESGKSPTWAPIIIPLLVLSLPLLDAIAVVLIRLKEHRPIYVGDNCHLSHRFVKLGISRPKSVMIIWLLNIIQCTGALTLVWLPSFGAFLVLLQAIAIFLVVSIIQFTVKEGSAS